MRVNIYNKGQIFGIKTPVVNFPMDEQTYQFLKELGVNIEEYVKPQHTEIKSDAVAQKNEECVKPQHTEIKADVAVQKEQQHSIHELPKNEASSENNNEKKVQVYFKDVYTVEDLEKVNKKYMKEILNSRGHYSLRTGHRDPLAPKIEDNRQTLINKVLETNKKID